ncbi:MAG: NUDIX domain-containing protein [Candidatus Daviesbacteria bacterium]|nr:NUDIX domain-containing protein [Candidatus Daviesbacteria bacterium]
MSDSQIILAVDDSGNFLEYIPKEVGHTGEGRRHLAIAVLLQNSKGQVLLQKRKHKIFDNIWDITGATHPLHKADGSDESLEEATRRCLETEWGIREVGELREVGEFNYFAQYGDYCENEAEPLLCENEHCHLMMGEYNGEVSLNSDMGYEYKWMKKEEFLADIKQNPEKYTPWAKAAVTSQKLP